MSISSLAETLNTPSSHPLFSTMDIDEANAAFLDKPPSEIMEWAIGNAERPVVLTNFRPLAVAFLHLVTNVRSDIPVIWIDTGYNTPATYRFVEKLTEKLNLQLHVYTSLVTVARRQALRGDIPSLDSPEHEAFSREVKLEPFERALREMQPDVWLNGIRRDQNEYRKTLDIFTYGPQGTVRVAPMFYQHEIDVEGYIYENDLPDNDDYFDPTKLEEHRECGLLLPN